MRKLHLPITVILTGLFFVSCNQETKVLDSEMYPPMPKFAEVVPYDDGSGLVQVTEYATDGVILQQGDYLDNMRQGVYTEFYKSGLVKSTCGYVNGLKQGQEILYDDRGTVEKRSTYHRGQLNGPTVIYNRNKIKEKRNYIEGKLHGELLKFYNSGVLMESSYYVDGQLDGVANWYDQEGNMTIEYRYEKGKRVETE